MTGRMPIHPGEILQEEFLTPHDLSIRHLAQAFGMDTNEIWEVIKGRRGITPRLAILLDHTFSSTAQFWMNLQSHYDLQVAEPLLSADDLKGADALAKELEMRKS